MRLLLVAALLSTACARNLRSRDPANWVELQSEHFVLRTDLPEDDAHKAISDLELVRAGLYATGWHNRRPAAERMQVVELASDRELHEFARQGFSGIMTTGAFGEPFILVAGQDIVDQPIVKHELTHVINSGFLVTQPRWVQEGIACYLETLRFDRRKNRVVLGEPSPERLEYLQRSPIKNYFSVIRMGSDFWTLSAEQGYAFETGAWMLVHWLVDTQPERFDAFLGRLARGENEWVAFSAEFPQLREEQVNAGIRSYFAARGGVHLGFAPMPEFSGEVASRRMGPGEVHALRAELIRLAPGEGTPADREARMRVELAEALAADPGDPLALKLSADDDPAPAVVAHPGDWRSWVLLFDRKKEQHASIEKAAQLAPQNAGVLYRLAFAEQEKGKSGPALEHAAKAAELAPGRPDVFDALAQIYAANHRCAEARDAEQRAIEALPDSGAPASFRRRLNEIENHCEQRSQIRGAMVFTPVLQSCSRPQPRARSAKDAFRADFTIAEDGSVTGVVVTGTAARAALAAFKLYVESCKFQPVLVEGKPQSFTSYIELRAGPR